MQKEKLLFGEIKSLNIKRAHSIEEFRNLLENGEKSISICRHLIDSIGNKIAQTELKYEYGQVILHSPKLGIYLFLHTE